ncbi:hypothetical protein T492DRAFT_943236 [Pavlovales sp. CCMP2436]|nr:hypothetical protein T492DRAFT_943236 [Pavlovales sp. CCMP2436]|mmetsp:Transcript_14226/g.36185  ORF Transcript_14226/g.36185 Transcript_14226/m.36185 type:complete len:245 (-) Transcript_14226:109-843(-)
MSSSTAEDCDYSTAGEGENWTKDWAQTLIIEAVDTFAEEACGDDDNLDIDVDDIVGKAFDPFAEEACGDASFEFDDVDDLASLLNGPAADYATAGDEEADGMETWADELMGFLDNGAASPVSDAEVLSAEDQLSSRRAKNRISARLCRLRKKETLCQLEARLGSLEAISRKLDEQLCAINAENHILQEGIRTSSNSSSKDEDDHQAKRSKTFDTTCVFAVPLSRCFGMKLAVGDSFDASSLIAL